MKIPRIDRTEIGLNLADSRHFGSDIDYILIEDLVKKQESTVQFRWMIIERV